MLEPCTVGLLAGVIVGALVGRGVPTHDTSRLLHKLGGAKVDKLIRLLELLEEPEPAKGGKDGTD